jgi:pantoate--beta-alanine ligase
MLIYKSVNELQQFLTENKHLPDGKAGKTIGFVPTMGALHQGHLSLIEASQQKADVTICSIFVNPIQFNKQEDLDNYPRNVDADVLKLESVNCDVLFLPSVEEMYPNKQYKNFEFGNLAEVMEGEHRPGHFNGVANVIERFFEIIHPNYAFFGEKDFQQLAIVKALTKQLELKTEIVGCLILREDSGLAMSSRNERLSVTQKKDAAIIFEALSFIKQNYLKYTIAEHKNYFSKTISAKKMELEYIEFADGNTLQPIQNFNETNYCVVFIAVHVGKVRLIDNVTIYRNQIASRKTINILVAALLQLTIFSPEKLISWSIFN